jgi:peptidyl-tRNA hydrolase
MAQEFVVNEEFAQTLVALGHDYGTAVQALKICNNDPDQAFDLLLSFPVLEETEAPMASTDQYGEPMKVVILARTDLDMSAGKIAAQASHAAIAAFT